MFIHFLIRCSIMPDRIWKPGKMGVVQREHGEVWLAKCVSPKRNGGFKEISTFLGPMAVPKFWTCGKFGLNLRHSNKVVLCLISSALQKHQVKGSVGSSKRITDISVWLLVGLHRNLYYDEPWPKNIHGFAATKGHHQRHLHALLQHLQLRAQCGAASSCGRWHRAVQAQEQPPAAVWKHLFSKTLKRGIEKYGMKGSVFIN